MKTNIPNSFNTDSFSFIYSINEIDQAVEIIYKLMQKYNIFTFTGTLGAGKTTLISALLKRCQVKEVVTSPTFTYVNQYTNAQGQTFYHFDLYRIQTLNSFLELGFEENLYEPNSWSFIEWPDIIMPLLENKSLKDKVCHINLEYNNFNSRILSITINLKL